MQHEQILTLITTSGLTLVHAYPHRRRYLVSLEVNGRFQNDALDFDKDNITIKDIQKMINASKADMLRAANTKSGILRDDMKRANKKNDESSVKSRESDTEKYLKKMRARGQKLAKTVRYG